MTDLEQRSEGQNDSGGTHPVPTSHTTGYIPCTLLKGAYCKIRGAALGMLLHYWNNFDQKGAFYSPHSRLGWCRTPTLKRVVGIRTRSVVL